jgi:ribonuclease G
MSDFGLVEMTRQRSRESLHQTLFCPCPYCAGNGAIKTHESISIEIERILKKVILYGQNYALRLVCHPELDKYLSSYSKSYLTTTAEKLNASLEYATDDNMHINDYAFFSTTNGEQIDF